MSQNTIPPTDDVAARIATQALAKRGTEFATEVRRLLDAALEIMGEQGTTARVRVADIVAAADLNNDAFYRYFPSKDALVAALLEDGTERLAGYIAHQMGKESTPEAKVRRWVEGVMSQTSEKNAGTTLAVLWNGSSFGNRKAGRHNASQPLAALLHEPFTALGDSNPDVTASLVAHAALGKMSDYLWSGTRPTRREIEQITRFCIDAAAPRPQTR
jgi:AcrR family transcriptional regulator